MGSMVIYITKADWKGDQIITRVNARKTDAVITAGQMVLSEAQSRAPIETGALRASGNLSVGDGEAQVSFSATNPRNGYPYCIRQHEQVFNHPRGGQDHYLSSVIEEDSGQVMRAFADAIRGAF